MINIIIILIIVSTLIFLKIKHSNLYSKIKSIFSIIIILIMVFYIVLYPREMIDATRDGIILWANVVLPSLLPFFIGAELLVGLGVVKFIGVLIEPIIRPIFNVPGEASFVFAMSITSGYPMGVKLTADLRKNNIINRGEAQRIISFCSTSGPLFMIGSVAIGMFNTPSIGPYIVLAHYLGAITVGILLRFLSSDEKVNYNRPTGKINIFKKAIADMLKERQKDGRPIGTLLSNSIKESISTLVLVGGLIVTFSVVTKELYLIGFVDYVTSSIRFITKDFIIIPDGMIEAVLTGTIEITMGCKIASEALEISPLLQVTLATMIISWSGLSVHAQTASIINNTDININSYILSKFFHSIISGIYVYTFLKVTNFTFDSTHRAVFSEGIENVLNHTWISKLIFSSYMFIGIFLTLIVIGVFINILKKT
ncbi:MAG: sporulation integral membrane protein YlbJ [Clostridia bacterium]|nr:sporulation integral membrane protein YlbJ [Clostridia bacterium]